VFEGFDTDAGETAFCALLLLLLEDGVSRFSTSDLFLFFFDDFFSIFLFLP
jgi:hypothetical protein